MPDGMRFLFLIPTPHSPLKPKSLHTSGPYIVFFLIDSVLGLKANSVWSERGENKTAEERRGESSGHIFL